MLRRARRFVPFPHAADCAPGYRLSSERCDRARLCRRTPFRGGRKTISDSIESSNIEASKVTGTTVYNRAGDKVGSINDVVIGKRDGQVKYAIMSFGGFLGMGEDYHPLPWEKLDYDERQGGYVVDIDKERLDGAPHYDSKSTPDWNDRDYGKRVDDYYGVGPAGHGRI